MDFSLRGPASSADVDAIEDYLGKSLPADYRRFLELSDGGEGLFGVHELNLWSAAEVIETNDALDILEDFEDFLFIGGDGGSEGFGLDLSAGGSTVVVAPFLALSRATMVPISQTFAELFLAMIAHAQGRVLLEPIPGSATQEFPASE